MTDVIEATDSLTDRTERRRVARSEALSDTTRATLGQFFTPQAAAQFIAGFPTLPATGELRVLDPGAGVGSLTAALVARVASEQPDLKLHLTTFELDQAVNADLALTLGDCMGVHQATVEQHGSDFIEWAVAHLEPDQFWSTGEHPRFGLIVMNPPYRKINKDSRERVLLQWAGIETTNLYTAFVALAVRLLEPGGQLVAITPRSFANGAYFREFRRDLLSRAALRHVHVFEHRNAVFADTDVLQENVIYLLEAGASSDRVVISSSSGYEDDRVEHTVPFTHVVDPADPQQFIHIATDPADLSLAAQMAALPATLNDLEITVSTGRVVDFRTVDNLRMTAGPVDAPLLYPNHLHEGRVRWPQPTSRKPNGLAVNDNTNALMLPMGAYVLVKRFSAKEEARRVAASLLTADDLPGPVVAVENHLNVYYHKNGPLPLDVATGLVVYLKQCVRRPVCASVQRAHPDQRW